VNSGKRLFLGLSFISLAILGSGVLLLLWLVMPRLQMLAPWLAYLLGGLALLFLLVVSGGLFLLFLSAITERDFLFPHGKKQVTVKVLYPINLFLGFLLGLGREKVGESFVEFNNALVRATRKRIDPGHIMILLPHCLQWNECGHRVTSDINNCRRCGKCVISQLAGLAERIDARIAVATGGTLARRLIVEVRPTVILAVACERDLVSGILDAYPIPVFGILNQRPNGPCFNTTVDMDRVQVALSALFEREH
jgi:hypothetical protein